MSGDSIQLVAIPLKVIQSTAPNPAAAVVAPNMEPMMLWVVIMYNLMWAATIDPGIIPRVQNPEVGMKKGCCYPVGLLLPSLPLGARG